MTEIIKRTGYNKGSDNSQWKDGKELDKDGYVLVYSPDHPFRNYKNKVRKHRLVMEEYLGRYLLPAEEVHHIKKVREGGTNDIENLMLFENHSKHVSYEQNIKSTVKKDMSNRYCLLCNGKTWIDKRGYEYWYKYKDGFICHKCYCKYVYNR